MRKSGAVRKFFRTPKGQVLAILAIIAGVAAYGAGAGHVFPGLVVAIVTAAAVDIAILRVRHRRWELPSGAIITGLIVAMVLSPAEPWHVMAVTSAVAVVSKYVFRGRL